MDDDEWWEDLPDDDDEWWGQTPGDDDVPGEPPPTPAERVFYVLGQLYLRWHRGELDVPPRAFDIEGVARLIGVAPDLELMTEGVAGVAYHFGPEVLVVLPHGCFPWVVWSTEGWAIYSDLEEFAAGLQ